MEEAPVQESPRRRFLVPVERPWKLWVFILGFAVAYLAWVVLIATRTIRTPTIPDRAWVYGGVGLFALLVLVELVLLIPRAGRKAKEEAATEDAWAGPDQTIYAPPAFADDPDWGEVVTTEEEVKGKRVLEFSHPPKTRHRGAVYAKAYVEVGNGYVLRVEELVENAQEMRATA